MKSEHTPFTLHSFTHQVVLGTEKNTFNRKDFQYASFVILTSQSVFFHDMTYSGTRQNAQLI